MQYDMFAASVNNLPTMLALIADYSPTLGSHYVAFRDIKMMNQLYKCNIISEMWNAIFNNDF